MMLQTEWGRTRDVWTAATHRYVDRSWMLHRHCLAEAARSCSGSKHLPGKCTNSQLLLPGSCIQLEILPDTFLCFRVGIS